MSIAQEMVDGILCQLCGVYIGEEVGYPRSCGDCKPKNRRKKKKAGKGFLISPKSKEKLIVVSGWCSSCGYSENSKLKPLSCKCGNPKFLIKRWRL